MSVPKMKHGLHAQARQSYCLSACCFDYWVCPVSACTLRASNIFVNNYAHHGRWFVNDYDASGFHIKRTSGSHDFDFQASRVHLKHRLGHERRILAYWIDCTKHRPSDLPLDWALVGTQKQIFDSKKFAVTANQVAATAYFPPPNNGGFNIAWNKSNINR